MNSNYGMVAPDGDTVVTSNIPLSSRDSIQQDDFDLFWQNLLQDEKDKTKVNADSILNTAVEQTEPLDPQTVLDQQVERVRQTVHNNPRFKQIHYHIMEYCLEQQLLRDIEAMTVTLPQFATCDQNQYRLINYLEDAGGLKRIELDEESQHRHASKEGRFERGRD